MPKICPPSETTAKKAPETPWTSVYTCGICSFIQAAQFSIYFSSMWPYLKELSPDISETMLGYIVAVYSFAQFIAAPSFGYWSNCIEQVRFPLMTGFTCMIAGNLIYLCLQLVPMQFVPYVMMLARLITGAGTGNSTLLRAYVAVASTPKDRSRAVACVSGGIAVGTMIGPAFQLLFTPLGEIGYGVGLLRLNIYTAPAVMALLLNLLGLVLMKFFFEEHELHLEDGKGSDNGKLMSPDMIALSICIFTRFTQIFVQTTIETVGSPYSMMMFSFDRVAAVKYNAAAHAAAGGIGAALYFFFIVFDAGKHLPDRVTSILSQVVFVSMFVVTYSWSFLPEYVSPIVNGTDEGCDFERFDWCSDLTLVYPWVYYSMYIMVFGVAFSFMNVSLTTLFSKVIGPRRQGTLQGFFQMAGSMGRMTAPLATSNLYAAFGPRSVWLLEMGETSVSVLIWVVFIKRLVPFGKRIQKSTTP